MNPALIRTAASAIPWKKVLENAPLIVKTAKRLLADLTDLFSKKKMVPITAGGSDLEARVAQLEKHEKAQSELIASMAEELQFSVQKIEIMEGRQRNIIFLTVISFLASLSVLLYLLIK